MIKFLKPGLQTTIQDKGREEYKHLGIPQSGYMDTKAAQLANLLVNNDPDSPVLEMCLLGCSFKVIKPLSIAVTGADMQFKINGVPASMHSCIGLRKDDVVSFANAVDGVYGYVAFSGKLVSPVDFKSQSMYGKAGLGLDKIKKESVLSVLNPNSYVTNSKLKRKEYLKKITILDCLPGPEFELFSEKSKKDFFKQVYTISKDANRMGIRLTGSIIELPVKNEIISSGIVKGTVQITKAGFPIVMMADAPTTGGYLRIVNLTEKACNQLSQIPINGAVQFRLKEQQY